ncbi:MAG: hypothetical protein IJH34_14400 [Romboutsia sp.]|nr:hypothetical protein [Romboutsia sp.]
MISDDKLAIRVKTKEQFNCIKKLEGEELEDKLNPYYDSLNNIDIDIS